MQQIPTTGNNEQPLEKAGIDIDKDAWEVIARASEQEALDMRDELDNMVKYISLSAQKTEMELNKALNQ